MSIKARKILFYSFILAFVIITPLVSLYAAGYKLSLSGDFLQKTGMLIIDSTPTEARIIIDNELQQKLLNKISSNLFNNTKEQNIIRTPAKIKGLIPGEYIVRLEKDGYWSWEKKLEILPGSSTFAEDVVLFRNNLPQPITSASILSSEQSPNKKYISIMSNDKYFLFNSDNEEILSLDKVSTSTSKIPILWLSNESFIADNYLFSVNDWSNPRNISNSLANIEFSDISPINSSSVYVNKNNNIVKIDLRNEAIETILNTEKLYDFTFKNNQIYTIEEINEEVHLVVYDNKKIIRQINLNFDDSYEFTNPDHDLINIYNKNFKALYLVDPFDNFSPLKETINNVTENFWVDKNKLVYYNDFEIWIYDRMAFKKSILTRISDNIKKVIWHPSNNYLLYSTNESLFTIELDNREKHSTNQLIKLKNIDHLEMNTLGDVLYFYSEIGKQVGLYKLSI